jgi:hypothetical protein
MPTNRALGRLSKWLLVLLAMGPFASRAQEDTNSPSSSRFSDKPAPMLDEKLFPRPRPLLEWGDKFLGSGNLQKGFNLPTGANWTPNLWVYGTFRTAVDTFDAGNDTRITEWANRLDLYANLQLSGTERILFGVRPLDRNGVKYSGYDFEPSTTKDWVNAVNFVPRTIFFEGEFGQLFPKLTDGGKRNLDYGFSIGRQPLLLQEGLLVNDDSIDLFGVTANALHLPFVPTARVTGLFGFGEIERGHNQKDPHALLTGIDFAADTAWNTLEATALYVSSPRGGDGFYSGIGSIQRFGRFNTVFRVANSVALKQADARVSNGTLLFSQVSFDPRGSSDLIYFNVYYGIDRFTAADLAPANGGPINRVGILNASPGLGLYGAPLNNFPERSVGGALGYQIYYGAVPRTQLILELGARVPTGSALTLQEQPAQGLAARFQKAFGKRFIVTADAFSAVRENNRPALGASTQFSYGGRLELMTKF